MDNVRQAFSYRRSIRLRDYDYRWEGAYFITICTYGKAKLFGMVDEGAMTLNDLGNIVAAEWLHIAKARPNILLDSFVVMPNHVHGIIFIIDSCNAGSDKNVTGVQPKASRTLLAGSLGAIVGHFKAAVSRRFNKRRSVRRQQIWQRNYHKHIIRSEQSLHEIRNYIIENPGRWRQDSMYVE